MSVVETDAAVTVRYFAGARAAAGVDTEIRPAASLTELVRSLAADHGARLTRVLAASSFLVDGAQPTDPEARLAPGTVIDVLPPFAGG